MPQRNNGAVTIEDVARAAGLSRGTASRVMSGSGPVSESARARVHTAAEQLGYVPDARARALAAGRGDRVVIGVVGGDECVLGDDYLGRVLRTAAGECDPHGIGVSVHWLPLSGSNILDRLAGDRSVHGMVLVNTTEDLLAAIPAGLRGRVASIGFGRSGVPVFDVDSVNGTGAVLEHLCASGRRRIAMITGPDWLPCARRPKAVYQRLMLAAGLEVRTVPGDFTARRGSAAAEEILDRWPDTDAIHAINDAAALGAMATLRRRGVQVPADVAVTGFDDIWYADLGVPALTTASHPVHHIAAAAMRWVLDPTPMTETTLFESSLVLRESA